MLRIGTEKKKKKYRKTADFIFDNIKKEGNIFVRTESKLNNIKHQKLYEAFLTLKTVSSSIHVSAVIPYNPLSRLGTHATLHNRTIENTNSAHALF